MKQTHRQNREWNGGMASTPETGRERRCDRAAEWEVLLYDYAEGLTDEGTGLAVERHIAECAYCRAALGDIRWMTSALRESVPEPQTDISARVMEVIREKKDSRAADESGGRIVAQVLDARTGRVTEDLTHRRGIRGVIRTLGGIAAAVLLIVGMMYAIPLLRAGGGTASGTPDILEQMQSCEDDRFSDGVFVGAPTQTTAETASDTQVRVTAAEEDPYPVILRIAGLTAEQVMAALDTLTASDGTPAHIEKTADGCMVTPLHAFERAQALLSQAYPGYGIEIIRAETIPDTDTGDAFYIQTDDPR